MPSISLSLMIAALSKPAGAAPPPPVTTYPPAMSANNVPSPYVASAVSSFGGSYAPWKAFNRVDPTGLTDRWLSGAGTLPNSWLKIDLGQARTILQYRMQAYSPDDASTQAPSVFKLQGSNDDSAWTDLDSQTGQTGWTEDVRTFTVASPGSYRYYRVLVADTNTSPYVTISELYLDDAITP